MKVHVVHLGRLKTMSAQHRRWLRTRQTIEQTIGHTKADHGMRRRWLKGAEGEALHSMLRAAGFNLRG